MRHSFPRFLIIILLFCGCSALTTSDYRETETTRNSKVNRWPVATHFGARRMPTTESSILEVIVQQEITAKEVFERKYVETGRELKPQVRNTLWIGGIIVAGAGYALYQKGQVVLGRDLIGLGISVPLGGHLIASSIDLREQWKKEARSFPKRRETAKGIPIDVYVGSSSSTVYTDRQGRLSIDISQFTSEAEPGKPLKISMAVKGYPMQRTTIDIPASIVEEHLLPPDYPPVLQITSTKFFEPSGNDILDAKESGTISFDIQNMGRGRAQRLKVSVRSLSVVSQLSYSRSQSIGNLEPRAHRLVEIPLESGKDLRDDGVTFRIEVSEAFGFDAAPFNLTIETRAFRPPKFTVADIGIDDATGNGMIEPGELITIRALIRNEGEGKAEGVVAQLSKGENVFFGGDSPTVFDIGILRPGSERIVEFQVYTNQRAKKMPVFLSINESLGQYGLPATSLELPFHIPMRSIEEVVIEGEELDTSGDHTRLSVDIEKDIPQGRDRRDNGLALIIANETYQHKDIPEVEFARRDGEFVKQYLIKALRYPPDKVFVVENATLGNLRTNFQLLRNITDSSSEVFVYYTGHGASSLGKEAQPYLVTSDCDPNFVQQAGMALDEFYREISQLGAKQIWVTIDACFSGMSSGGPIVQDISIIAPRIKYPAVADNRMTIFTSASGQEVSSWYREMKHSLYTYYFLKGLRGEADQNKDREISTEELQSYLLEMVPTKARSLYNREQYPGLITGGKTQILVRY